MLNLASNTFNENETSYYHKSIGGYHAAKLRRYQEMIEQYISPEMQALYGAVSKAGGDMTQVKGDSIYPVLNMLNTKYFIFPLEGGQTVPIQNPYVYGNAWLVDKLDYVNNANEEMEAIGKIDLRHQAVADAKTATVDGQSAELGRVNYILRAMNIQPGKHQVELSFFPKTVDRTEAVAYTAYGILILLVLGAVFVEWKKRQDKKQEN